MTSAEEDIAAYEADVELFNKSVNTFTEELGRSPEPIPAEFNASDLVKYTEEKRAEWSKAIKKGKKLSYTTYYDYQKHCCRAAFSSLVPTVLKRMKTRQVHEGFYLPLRSIAPPIPGPGLIIAVADTNGMCIVLHMESYIVKPLSLGTTTLEELDAVWPVGTLFAINEPRVCLCLETGQFRLFVDSYSDLVVPSAGDQLFKATTWKLPHGKIWRNPKRETRSSNDWKAAGNAMFARGEYFRARYLYTQGIEQHPLDPNVPLLRLNRSATDLHLERYHDVLADTKITQVRFSGDPTLQHLHGKCLIRRAKAYYGLRRWTDAGAIFESLLDSEHARIDAKQGLDKCAARMREATDGAYDLETLYKQTRVKPNVRLDASDYFGAIEVFDQKGMGRGLRTTRDVKAGELLMAHKALSIAYPDDRPANMSVKCLSMRNKIYDSQCAVLSRDALMYRMYHCPEIIRCINGLDAGPDCRKPTAYPLSVPLPLPGLDTVVDADRVHAVTNLNDAYSAQISVYQDIRGTVDMGDKEEVVSLHGPVSLINHACLCNTGCRSIGDMHFNRALVDIPIETPLSIAYQPDSTYTERKEPIACVLDGEVCHCQWCEDDRKDGDDKVAIRDNFNPSLDYTAPSRVLKKFVVKLKDGLTMSLATYGPHHGPFKPTVHRLYLMLGGLYSFFANTEHCQDHNQTAIHYFRLSLTSLGVSIRPHIEPGQLPVTSPPRAYLSNAIIANVHLASAYKQLGKHELCKAWLEAAIWFDALPNGDCRSMFKTRFKDTLTDSGTLDLI